MNERDAIIAETLLANMSEKQKNETLDIIENHRIQTGKLMHGVIYGDDTDPKWYPSVCHFW